MNKTDVVKREDEEWSEASQKWLAIHRQIKLLEAEERALRETLIHMAGDQNVTGGGVRLSRSTRKGYVQYDRIPELQNVDLDQYRKEPLEVWRLVPTEKRNALIDLSDNALFSKGS